MVRDLTGNRSRIFSNSPDVTMNRVVIILEVFPVGLTGKLVPLTCEQAFATMGLETKPNPANTRKQINK